MDEQELIDDYACPECEYRGPHMVYDETDSSANTFAECGECSTEFEVKR